MNRKIILIITIISAIFLLIGCTQNTENQIENDYLLEDETSENTNTNDEARDKDAQETPVDKDESEKVPLVDFTLSDGKGNDHTLSDYKGKVILVNFWGTWCPYCVEEMPYFESLYQQNQGDLEILAINVQSAPQERPVEEVLEWVEQQGVSYNVLFDIDGSVAQEYYVRYFPTTYIIDREGYVLGYINGLDEELLEDILDELI
ncbi:peroxiredoxin [Natranaerovirga hydrolytica]|uniref:Peroxiredoxin n=1 Tax=Natranaerovirga hydrolytica TaxID=680378 RepID=A0A4V2Q054_9FIRM|nr:TlpA disulfide reductase family protein [Natranaerovirga hydrolytica]TCK92461.1 peroxiredoxin [Natranaerovirga hydrolytica]